MHSYVHPDLMSGGGMPTRSYQQPCRSNRGTIKKAKENPYIYIDSTRRQPIVTSAITTHWPDSAAVQSSPIVKKKFYCPRCNSGYTRLSDMKTHCQFQCGKEPRYECPYCTKKAKFSSNMYVHVRRMHNDKKLQIVDLYKQQQSRCRNWGYTNGASSDNQEGNTENNENACTRIFRTRMQSIKLLNRRNYSGTTNQC